MRLRLSTLMIYAALFLVGIGGVTAEPSSADRKDAQAAFARAEAAEARRDWRTAIEEYQRAYDLVPHANVLFNIAHNFELLEDYRNAAAFYRRYLDDTTDDAERDRIKKLIGALRLRPATLTVTSDPSGASVMVNGESAGATPLELELSGAHQLDVSVGDSSEQRTVTIEFAEPQTLHILLRVAPADAADVQDHGADTLDVARHAAAPTANRRKQTGLAVAATGIIFIGGGLWLGSSAMSEYDRATAVCGSALNCTTLEDYEFATERVDAARRRGNVATVVGSLGLAAAITGVVLWIAAPSPRDRPSQDVALRIEPQVGAHGLGLTATGAF